MKIESITVDDPERYESILTERSIRIGNTSIKEEDVTDDLQALLSDIGDEDNDLEDSYDLDAGIEEET